MDGDKTLADNDATLHHTVQPMTRVLPTLARGGAVGSLQVLSPLGEGGMGATWVARHPILRSAFVIKTFKTATEDPFKEAWLAARVSSPNVVPIVDAGRLAPMGPGESGLPYLVHAYVDGLDLREIVAAVRALGRTLPPGLVARLVEEVAQGLHACHKAGVVHCDVKPSNILLHGSGSAMLGDFGIAQTPERRQDDDASLTGSPAYLAPEMWREAGMPSRRSDIYALGVTAHQLLTGQLPFSKGGNGARDWREAHLTHHYEPPAPRSPREAYLFSVVARMLAKNPAARPETAETVATLMEPMVDFLPKFIGRGGEGVGVGPVRIDVAVEEEPARVDADALAVPVGIDPPAPGEIRGPDRLGEVAWVPEADGAVARHRALVAAGCGGTMCIQRALLRLLLGAEARGIGRLATPALGTGEDGVPMELSAKLMLETIRTFTALRPQRVREIRVMVRARGDLDVWRGMMEHFSGRSHHGHLQQWEG